MIAEIIIGVVVFGVGLVYLEKKSINKHMKNINYHSMNKDSENEKKKDSNDLGET